LARTTGVVISRRTCKCDNKLGR
jgi:hypothetical protein